MPADYSQDLRGAKVIPDAVRSEDQDITMTDLMVRYTGVAGIIAQRLSAKDFGSGQYLGRYYGQLVWGIEGVRLGIGVIMNSIEAKLNEARVSKAFGMLASRPSSHPLHESHFATWKLPSSLPTATQAVLPPPVMLLSATTPSYPI